MDCLLDQLQEIEGREVVVAVIVRIFDSSGLFLNGSNPVSLNFHRSLSRNFVL